MAKMEEYPEQWTYDVVRGKTILQTKKKENEMKTVLPGEERWGNTYQTCCIWKSNYLVEKCTKYG